MEDDHISSPGLRPLFIKEEDADPNISLMEQSESGLTFAGTQVNQSSLIKPYLQEMDGLLKSCEELTGLSFGSRFNETSLAETSYSHSREETKVESHGETIFSPQAYLSTSYIDTHMDGSGTEDQPTQDQSQMMGTIDRCQVTSGDLHQKAMPLTSAGKKLSETMVEYEGQLLGMLAMLESCMEESGMDFEPQGWATEASQEYVHISKNPHRGTTLVPIQQESPRKFETQPMQFEYLVGQHVEDDKSPKKTRYEETVGSAGNGNQSGLLMETLEWQDQGALDPRFRFSGPSMPLESKENAPMYCEAMTTTNKATSNTSDITGIEVNNTEVAVEDRQEDLETGMNELSALGCQMEKCIEEVQQLQKRRKELLMEVLELRGNKDTEEAEGIHEEETEEQIEGKVAELIKALKREEEGRREERKKEIQSLREERAEEERRLWKVNLERQGLHDEFRKLKRRLFSMVRDCAHNQAALNTQHREVELLKREEERLQSLVLQLTEECSQRRAAQNQQLLDLKAQLHARSASQTSNTQDELQQSKRHSCGDIQQYVQAGLKALEDRYEPILLTLLKRRETTVEALAKAREQAQEMRAQLRPLKEEIQKLSLQRACLEEKLKLIHIHRREDVGQYKETVYFLEESSRELKTELKIQKRKTKEIEELRDSLTKQVLLYRTAIEDLNKRDDKEKT
ncbi:hypothetical protein PBY51_005452 [Eleginops maclovinus]|uniref:Syncoilin n=1 Tax=Eleginops maclovinus TaxID=56733 RepID=A0AAN7X8E8_ELEMC|nr:hypothetical protein PBY51_005452 [Eleginops maclovinus]